MFCKASALIIMLSALLCNTCYGVEVSARASVLFEPSTRKVLFDKNMNKPMEIASTTKIMTAVVVLENVKTTDVVTIKKHCTGVEGSSIYLKEGEKISVLDLLHGLMLESGNDAALALADYVGKGDAQGFVALMNKKAADLGLINTRFQNPNGLPSEGHYSSAYDMAVLIAYAMETPGFRDIVSKQSYSAGGRYMKNHNRLLRMCRGVDGGKTGFTRAAGRCLVSSAVRNDVRLVAVTLSAPNDWNDHINLYDYGYNNYSRCSFLKENEIVAAIPVVGCEEPIKLTVKSTAPLYGIFSSSELRTVRLQIALPRFLYAPVKQGQVIGEAALIADDAVIGSCELVTEGFAEYYDKPGFADKVLRFFKGK